MEYTPINWYPGHMAKTKKVIIETLKMVDLVVEIVDARIPNASRNPDFDSYLSSVPRLIILNKQDLADPKITALWADYYKKKGYLTIVANSKAGKGLGSFFDIVKQALKEKTDKKNARGLGAIPLRLMVVGIPNCGKSTFINKLSKSSAAKVEDRPGVTRGKQLINLGNGFELIDMPGMLWGKIENAEDSLKLAVTGAIRDAITDMEYLAQFLLETIRDTDNIKTRYKIENYETLPGDEILNLIAKKRGFILSGGVPDLERGAKIVIDEFRAGLLGTISLEKPDDMILKIEEEPDGMVQK